MGHEAYYTQLCTPFLDLFSLTVSTPRPMLNEAPSSPYPTPGWMNTHQLHEGYLLVHEGCSWTLTLKQQVGSKFGQLHHTSYILSDEQLQLDLHQDPQFCLCSSLWPEDFLGWTLAPISHFCLVMLCLCQEIFQVLTKHGPGFVHHLWTQMEGCIIVLLPRGAKWVSRGVGRLYPVGQSLTNERKENIKSKPYII